MSFFILLGVIVASLIAVVFVPFVFFVGRLFGAQLRAQRKFKQDFAAANGYTYSPSRGLDGLDGAPFHIGYGKSATDVVSGTHAGCPVSLFTYAYATPGEKTDQVHFYTVLELQFDAAMPDILLEKNENTFGEPLFEKASVTRELIKLEGDFNQYFSLSVPKGYTVEALEVFTPDVMQELIAKCRSMSLEIVNGHLFIYADGVITTKEGIDALYDAAGYFAEKLGPVLARMKRSVEAMAR